MAVSGNAASLSKKPSPLNIATSTSSGFGSASSSPKMSVSSTPRVSSDHVENKELPSASSSPKLEKSCNVLEPNSLKKQIIGRPSEPVRLKSPDFATKLAESNRTPKLTPKNTQNLALLKIAPELKNGKSPSSSNPSPRSIRSVRSEDKREERPLLGPTQKIVIVPVGKGDGMAQVKVTVGSGSSDSSDGRRTPPRKRSMSGGKRRTALDRGVRMSPSLKSLRGASEMGRMRSNASWASFFPEIQGPRPLSDVVSVRSLASIGMGSTDGKKLTIRRVPTSPTELLNLADPRT